LIPTRVQPWFPHAMSLHNLDLLLPLRLHRQPLLGKYQPASLLKPDQQKRSTLSLLRLL
jgi:hypothetical protein